MEGWGDMVAKFTQVTGIKAVVEAITDDCGCEERRRRLNEMFPFSKPEEKNLNYKPKNDISTPEH